MERTAKARYSEPAMLFETQCSSIPLNKGSPCHLEAIEVRSIAGRRTLPTTRSSRACWRSISNARRRKVAPRPRKRRMKTSRTGRNRPSPPRSGRRQSARKRDSPAARSDQLHPQPPPDSKGRIGVSPEFRPLNRQHAAGGYVEGIRDSRSNFTFDDFAVPIRSTHTVAAYGDTKRYPTRSQSESAYCRS